MAGHPLLLRCVRFSLSASLLPLLLGAPALAQDGALPRDVQPSFLPADAPQLPPAGFEDYREPAGRVVDGALRVTLEAVSASWRPWGEDGPTVRAHTFGLEGADPKVPGPCSGFPPAPRSTSPSETRWATRCSSAASTTGAGSPLRGCRPGQPSSRPPSPGTRWWWAPGETVEVRFTPTVSGSFFYYGKTFEAGWSAEPQPLFGAEGPDHTLTGVLIVDPPGEEPDPDERIFLISHYMDEDAPGTWLPAARFMINGRSWPNTERLVYDRGDTVRWRVINQSGAFHPMHLHGFYFHVDAFGGQGRESRFDPQDRPFVVTRAMAPTRAFACRGWPTSPATGSSTAI